MKIFRLPALSVPALFALVLLAPRVSAAERVVEAESYQNGRSTSGPSSTTEIDLRASGREWVKLSDLAEGGWLQFHVPNLRPGRYQLEIRYVESNDGAGAHVSVGEADGSQQITVGELPAGTKREMSHGSAIAFKAVTIGDAVFARPGIKTIRFTATKSPAGTSPASLGIDRLTFTEIADPSLVAPTALQVTARGPVHLDFTWTNGPVPTTASGYLIERLGPPWTDWTTVGFVPPHVSKFVATGMLPNTAYQHRVRAWSANGLGAVSTPLTASTEPAGKILLGQVIEKHEAAPSRAGEGSVVVLRDGRMLMYYNSQAHTDDFTNFEIHQKESRDHGATWTPGKPFLRDPADQRGYMMPSLLRLKDGRLAFSYAERVQVGLVAHRVFRISTDEAATWSEPVRITTDLPLTADGLTYTGATGPHDRLIQAENGDLFLPVHLTTGGGVTSVDPANDRSGPLLIAATVIYRSSDLGRSWQRVFGPARVKGTMQTAPYPYPWTDQLLSEPGLVETAPRHLLIQMRNPSGFFYESRSTDHGATWSPVAQSPLNAPIAPAKLLRVSPGIIAAVFNPWVGPTESNLGRRFALGSMISRDEGLTWEHFKLIDVSDPAQRAFNFCYPYFCAEGDSLHAFYFGGRSLDMTYRRLPADWFTN